MNGVTIVIGADSHAELRLGPECRLLRERLGMTAWVALEALVLAAESDGTVGVTVAASARDLAVRLGIGKDRAAAALSVLRDAGLLVRIGSSAGRSTRFAAHRYEIRLSVSRVADAVPSPVRPIQARETRKAARVGARLFETEQ